MKLDNREFCSPIAGDIRTQGRGAAQRNGGGHAETLPMERWKAPFRDPIYVAATAGLVILAMGAGAMSFRSHGPVQSPSSAAVTSIASSTPVSTPAAATTPAYSDVLLDARRQLDLGTLADALERYRTQYGAYPATNNQFQTVCFNQFDTGCQLLSVTPNVPGSDGETPYWYRSNGRTFTLFAPAAIAPSKDACPAEFPAALGDGPLYCLLGGER